jgi:hypothetical protein
MPASDTPAAAWLVFAGVLASGQAGNAQAGLDERVEPGGGDRRPHPLQRPYQPQMQHADHVPVVLGHLAERALP